MTHIYFTTTIIKKYSAGPLSAVTLRTNCSSNQIIITWNAPHSLNVTNSSHGIRYLIAMTSRDDYTLSAGNESITVPADLPVSPYTITVTPYNGPENNRVYGNSSSITIRTCQGKVDGILLCSFSHIILL